MKSTLHTLPALLATSLCLYLYLTAHTVESQYVPTRCMCPKTKSGVRGPFSDFKVTLRGTGCIKDEIIVVLRKDNRHVCLSPQAHQGKRLLKCWHRKKKEGKNEKTCMGQLRMRPQKRRHSKSRSPQ